MTTLTHRYIDQVVGRVAADQRDDVAAELEGLLADMVEERTAAGVPEAEAERSALTELGDPARLARRYRGAEEVLIGPELYPGFVLALRWLLPFVAVVALVTSAVDYAASTPVPHLGQAIGAVAGPLIQALFGSVGALVLLFWVLDRVLPVESREAVRRDVAPEWTVDALDDDPGSDREACSEAWASLVFLAVAAVLPVLPTSFLYVGHLNDGAPFVNQALWDFWIPAYYVLLAVGVVQAVWVLIRRRQTPGSLVLQAALTLVTAVFFTALVLTQQVIDPAIAAGPVQTGVHPLDWVDGLYVAVIWLVALWELWTLSRQWRTRRRSGRRG